MSWQSHGVALLAASLVRPFALAAGAWLFIRVFSVRHPSSRHSIWTAVLLGMLLLPAVSALMPHWNLPLLPGRARAEATVDFANVSSVASAPAGGGTPLAATASSAVLAGRFNLPTATTMILAGYFAGLSAMAIYWAVGWCLLGRLVSRSRWLRAPWLRASADVASPVTAGVFRPTVILPAGWRAWDAAVRRAVLVHEFAHIRRHDALARSLGRLVECIFWFHPLAWWLSRKTAELAELACDAAVLEKTNDPGGYSRTLIEFAEGVSRAGHRAALPGLAMARPGSELGRRIDQLFELSRMPARRLYRPGLLLATLGLPVLCIAATAGLRAHSAPADIKSPPRVAPPAWAQSPAPASKFDVASIRPVPPDVRESVDVRFLPGRFVATSLTLAQLVEQAYGIEPRELTGGPDWINSIRYDVVGTTGGEVPREQAMRMLQALLAERFQLRIEKQMHPGTVYTLTAPKPHGFDPPAHQDERPLVMTLRDDDNGTLSYYYQGHNATMALLIERLAAQLEAPVMDRTGLTGRHDFKVHFAYDFALGGVAPDPNVPTIFTALKDQLGLKLEAGKGPVETWLVKSATKPAGN